MEFDREEVILSLQLQVDELYNYIVEKRKSERQSEMNYLYRKYIKRKTRIDGNHLCKE